jgi:hypothetical protein
VSDLYRYQMEDGEHEARACPLLTAGLGEATACARDLCEWWRDGSDPDYSQCVLHRLAQDATFIAYRCREA